MRIVGRHHSRYRSAILWARQNGLSTRRKEALTMRTSWNTCSLMVVVIFCQGAAYGQDAGTTLPTLPTADTGTVPIDPTLPVAEPAPPQTVPPWSWQHQTQNQQGTVTNLRERTQAQDGSGYSYQHSVTRPSGSQTQLREYSQTEEGYNYQRQMTHTFRDGRTMENTVTRSYDGTAGSMERSFIGPNGQVHQFERSWTPDNYVEASPVVDPSQLPTPQDLGLPTAGQLDPLAPETAKSDKGFWSWLNPFKNRESKQTAGSSATAKRSGFTIGSFGRSRQLDTMPPGQTRKSSGLSSSSQMRTMKTKQTGPPSHAAASLPGAAGKKH
jgi:hypothetical protein